MLSILFGQTIQNGAYACIHSAWLDYFGTCGRDRHTPYAFFAYSLERLNIGLHVHCARDRSTTCGLCNLIFIFTTIFSIFFSINLWPLS